MRLQHLALQVQLRKLQCVLVHVFLRLLIIVSAVRPTAIPKIDTHGKPGIGEGGSVTVADEWLGFSAVVQKYVFSQWSSLKNSDSFRSLRKSMALSVAP